MRLTADIRPLKRLLHEDVAALNFIRHNPRIRFRKHYREGLRSQIIEVLFQEDLDRERMGIIVNGTRRYPRARPRKMLRLFRAPFPNPEEAFEEAQAFSILKKYLGREHLAQSSEFIVTYRWDQGEMIMLCGLQQYVEGPLINPWTRCQGSYGKMLYQTMTWSRDNGGGVPPRDTFLEETRQSVTRLIARVHRMIRETGVIPDLAGVGNLILTPQAQIKLVDINNVSPVDFEDRVYLDGRGYPVSDKSVEVLALLEEKILGRSFDRHNPLYAHFLAPRRMSEAREM